jgi:membrane protease YdiL (CAAX protease family)
MENNITFVDILKLLAFILFLIMPPWFVFVAQFRRRTNRALIVFMTFVYLIVTTFALLFSPYTQTVIPFIIVLITISIIRRRQEREELTYYLRSIRGRTVKIVWYSLIFKVGTLFITMYFISELQKLGIKIEEQEISNELMRADWTTTVLLSILAAVIAPVLEEFVFRHIFYRGFSKKIGPVLAAIVSSLMFTALHFNIASSAAIFAVGLFNCYLYEREGYRAAVVSHFIFNFTSLLMAFVVKLSGVNITQFINY